MQDLAKPDSELLLQFNEFRLERQPFNYRAFIYTIKDGHVRIQDTVELMEPHDDFLDLLPERKCRFVVYRLDYELADGNPAHKFLFFTWSPEGACDKEQAQYKASAPALQRVLYGTIVVVAHTKEQLAFEKLLEVVEVVDKANENESGGPEQEDQY